MIYIVEIPHSRRASCWTALSRQDFINKCAATYQSYGNTPESGSFEDWVAYNGRDLSSQYVYESSAEANQALRNGEITGHGSGAALSALKAQLIRWGEIAADLQTVCDTETE